MQSTKGIRMRTLVGITSTITFFNSFACDSANAWYVSSNVLRSSANFLVSEAVVSSRS